MEPDHCRASRSSECQDENWLTDSVVGAACALPFIVSDRRSYRSSIVLESVLKSDKAGALV